MALSSSDLIQVLIGVVATAAGIGSALRSLRKLSLSNGLVLFIGLILLVASAIIVVTFPFVSTFIYLAGGAGAIGFVAGGFAWASKSHDFTVIALTLACTIVVGGAFAWGVKNAQAQPAPVPLPGIASATTTPLIATPTNTTAATATRSPTKTTSSKTSSGGSSPSGSSGSSGGSGGSGNMGGVTATPTSTLQPGIATSTPFTPTPTPIPVAVNGANAAITSTTPNGCYPEVQVSGTIMTNGGQGLIDYYWGRSDGSSSPAQSVGATSGKTSYGVSDDWYPNVGGSPSTYWDELFVTSPGSAHSPQASETLSC